MPYEKNMAAKRIERASITFKSGSLKMLKNISVQDFVKIFKIVIRKNVCYSVVAAKLQDVSTYLLINNSRL